MRATQPKRQPRQHPLRVSLLALTIALGAMSSCTWRASDQRVTRPEDVGDRQHGREVIGRVGCGACHQIPGIVQAKGSAGPPLNGIATRSYVGGALPNNPPNMVAWIQHPTQIDPATAMPDLGLTDAEARDVAAYLYTLR